MRVARLLRCQGSAACIIATIWPPESHLRTSQDTVENELWAKCARRALAGFASPKSCRSAAKECTFPPYKTRSKLPPSARIMPLLYPDGILARHGSSIRVSLRELQPQIG